MDKTKVIQIAERGLWRFYDEGYYRWPYDKLQSLYQNIELADQEIQSALLALEKQGYIKIIGQKECYIEVLNAPQG